MRESMLAALTNVRASHLLDTGLWQKLGLSVAPARGDAFEGDKPALAAAREPPERTAPGERVSLRVLL